MLTTTLSLNGKTRPDSPSAPVLTREQRRLLLAALDLIPAFDDPVGRDLLLLDLPSGAIRSPVKSVDLGHLVRAAEAWGVLNDGMPALLMLLQNALDLSSDARLLRTVNAHAGAVFAVAVTPDGRQILSGAGDRTLGLWDLDTGQPLRTFTGHTDAVYAVAVSPSGRYALSAGCDGTVRVWNLATGRLLRTLTEHRGRVLALAVAPDGRAVMSAGDDGLVRLWRVPPGLLTDAR